MTNALYNPVLSFYLRAVKPLAHTYQDKVEGVMLYPEEGGGIFSPLRRQANCLEASPSAGEHAYVVVTPGIDRVGSYVDVNEFHAAYDHTNEGAPSFLGYRRHTCQNLALNDEVY